MANEGDRWARTVLHNASDMITILETNATIRYVSAAVERILGYRPEELVGTLAFDYVHPEDMEFVSSSFAQALENPGVMPPIEFRLRTADGSWRDVEATRNNLLEDSSVRGVVVNARDITERKEAEERLRESEERFNLLAEIGRDFVFRYRFKPTPAHDYVTPWATTITGYTPEEFYADPHLGHKMVHPDDRHFIDEVLRSPESPITIRWRRKDGELLWSEQRNKPIYDEAGELVAIEGIGRDVTEYKRIEEQLEHRALHDLLTNLPNRHLFVDRLKQALRRTRREKGRQAAVLFMDIDDFKAINDSLGHEIGDVLLVGLAERLRRCLRPEDTLARFGGDEFVVLIEDVQSPEDAVRVTERIVEGLREPFIVEERELFLRISIGVVLGTARQNSPEDLLRDADTAMYEAKEAGLDYRMFDPAMYERVVGRLELENELRRAIEAEEFVVHYQPIMSLKTGQIWGVEALVRWSHPEQGLLDPWKFMAVAEQSGIVVPMGEWVLQEACRQAKEWQEEHHRIPPLVISVNLSARQLQRPDIAQIVERVLKKTGLESRYLRLDITETVYIKALEGNTQALDELRRLGVSISIDDFGTGYSSLAYLKRLPASALKIDKSFVKGVGEDLEDTAIVGMVRELAHTLGMEAIAEGVESEAQATILKEMGCDMAQGYHFSKPLPPQAARRFLEEERPS